jgi:hypothetical protein
MGSLSKTASFVNSSDPKSALEVPFSAAATVDCADRSSPDFMGSWVRASTLPFFVRDSTHLSAECIHKRGCVLRYECFAFSFDRIDEIGIRSDSISG